MAISRARTRIQLVRLFLCAFGLFASQTFATPSASIRKIATGQSHACALWESGEVKCWGSNRHGELGLGDRKIRGDAPETMGAQLPFVQLGRGRRAVDIGAGNGFNCALLDDATVKCWGKNTTGQLGQGDTRPRGQYPGEMGDYLAPVNLGKGVKIERISVGFEHACALTIGGRLKCWGGNDLGQLGLGDNLARGTDVNTLGDNLSYVDLGTQGPLLSVALGIQHSCAILDTRIVKCWGRAGAVTGTTTLDHVGDQPGEMGDRLSEIPMPRGKRPISLSSRGPSACVFFETGEITCWGENFGGQLGLGDTKPRGTAPAQELGDNLFPCSLAPGLNLHGVGCGTAHCCAWFESGTAKCWGVNYGGQLGLGDVLERGSKPNQMGNSLPFLDLGRLSVVKSVYPGNNFACAVLERRNKSDGVKCWGDNFTGQLGLGDSTRRGDTSHLMGDALPFLDL